MKCSTTICIFFLSLQRKEVLFPLTFSHLLYQQRLCDCLWDNNISVMKYPALSLEKTQHLIASNLFLFCTQTCTVLLRQQRNESYKTIFYIYFHAYSISSAMFVFFIVFSCIRFFIVVFQDYVVVKCQRKEINEV